MSDFGVRWDAGLEPPDACEDEAHDEASGHCPSCCKCEVCAAEEEDYEG